MKENFEPEILLRDVIQRLSPEFRTEKNIIFTIDIDFLLYSYVLLFSQLFIVYTYALYKIKHDFHLNIFQQAVYIGALLEVPFNPSKPPDSV